MVDDTIKKTAACPHCQARYKVSEQFANREVACRNCGQSFKVSFESPPAVDDAPNPANSKSPFEKYYRSGTLLSFSDLCLQMGLVNSDQLSELDGGADDSDLAEILVKKGLIKPQDLENISIIRQMQQARSDDLKFGRVAVQRQWANPADVDKALAEQDRIFARTSTIALIGDIMVKSGLLTEDQRRGVLATIQSQPEADADQGEGFATSPDKTAAAEEGEFFEISVSSDRLEAYLTPRRELPAGITPEFVKDFAAKHGIKQGLLDDSALRLSLEQAASTSKSWLVARGQPPSPGRAAQIAYHFNVDPFGVGTLKEGGNIDFRDRGRLPQVGVDDLIAELTPGENGLPGVDVYGRVIPAERPRNVMLRCGKGVRKSDDGLKAFAKIAGRPVLSTDGLLSVYPEFVVQGDVGYDTGHVDFDGHIEIRGVITEGFRVHGGSLLCGEINKGEVSTEGDITVLGGVIGARVQTNGNCRARYVQNSTIEALGDVVLEKEIYHSVIECDGMCICTSSTLLGSNIVAKNGLVSVDIGSDASKPTVIQIGVGARVTKMVEEIKIQIAQKRKRQQVLDELIAEYLEKLEPIYRHIGERDLIWDLSEAQRRTLQNRFEKSAPSSDPGQVQKVEAILERLETTKQEVVDSLAILAEEQEKLVKQIIDRRQEIVAIDLEILELDSEIDQLVQWSEAEDKLPSVKASGTVYPETTIKGRYAVYIFREALKRVAVREVRREDENGHPVWEMAVASF